MSIDTQTKLAIYRHFAETGQRPSLQVVAERVRADVSSVREAYVRLRAQRVLVLEPDGVSIRMAPPFSGIPTQHVVIVVYAAHAIVETDLEAYRQPGILARHVS